MLQTNDNALVLACSSKQNGSMSHAYEAISECRDNVVWSSLLCREVWSFCNDHLIWCSLFVFVAITYKHTILIVSSFTSTQIWHMRCLSPCLPYVNGTHALLVAFVHAVATLFCIHVLLATHYPAAISLHSPVYNNLAVMYGERGKTDLAIENYQQSLAKMRLEPDVNQLDLSGSMFSMLVLVYCSRPLCSFSSVALRNLAACYYNIGQLEDAQPLSEEALSSLKKLPPSHPHLARCRRSTQTLQNHFLFVVISTPQSWEMNIYGLFLQANFYLILLVTAIYLSPSIIVC